MHDPGEAASPVPEGTGTASGGRFPTAFTILFVLIAVVAALTWIVPAGQYERTYSEALGREAPVPGTYAEVEPNPQGWWDVLMAPIAGLYDPATGTANAIDVAVFVLVIGGFLAVVTKTGAIDAGIGWLLRKLEGREIWMIPILMVAFAAGGTSYGMAEESLAFYAIVLPVFIRAGYDALTGVAVIMLGAGIGTLGSTFNAFATVIASNAAGVPFTEGLLLRAFILLACLVAGILYVMRYAARVKADPAQSMSALFLGMAILVWIVGKFAPETRLDEHTFVETFVNGARDLLGVALIIGVARGIVVVMDAGKVTDTILHALAGSLAGLGDVVFINTMLVFQTILSFLVPSSSGLAVLTMPILAPLSDFAGVQRDLTVTAYQSANGWVNLFNPTFAVVMGGLAIGRVSYDRWLRFLWPLLLILAVIIAGALSVGAMTSDAPPAPTEAPAE
jgi:uncharacterized ion transporter superfamily protein YfcC